MRLFHSSLNNNKPSDTIIYGCTDPTADNYNPLATVEDGSCVYSGWTLPENSVRITCLTGQSNAAGSGYNSDALASEIDETSDLKVIARYTSNIVNLNIAAGNNEAGLPDRHGLELGLSVNHPLTYSYPLYLAKYAVGGTAMDEQLFGGVTFTRLYHEYIVVMVNQLLAQGKRVFIDMILIQGENDAVLPYQVDNYPAKLDTWINLWKTYLGSNIPISLVEIYGSTSQEEGINTAFANAASTYSNVEVIEASTLPTNDGLHYSYAGLKTISERYLTRIAGIQPAEITVPLTVPSKTPPATPTISSVVQTGSILTVIGDVGAGDSVTAKEDLFFKLYDGFNPYHVFGTSVTDANVSISGTQFTLVAPVYMALSSRDWTVQQVNEAGFYSAKSNVISLGLINP